MLALEVLNVELKLLAPQQTKTNVNTLGNLPEAAATQCVSADGGDIEVLGRFTCLTGLGESHPVKIQRLSLTEAFIWLRCKELIQPDLLTISK